MMEAVRTSETSVDNHFTRQYIPEDNSEQKAYKWTEDFLFVSDKETRFVAELQTSGCLESL
jgi:hypothetical protein